jgi:hypothetical protein
MKGELRNAKRFLFYSQGFSGLRTTKDALKGEIKMGLVPKSGDDSLAPGPFDPEVDRR